MLLRSRSLNIPENLNNVKSFDPTEFVLDWNRFDAVIGQEPAPEKGKEKSISNELLMRFWTCSFDYSSKVKRASPMSFSNKLLTLIFRRV